MAFPNFTRLGVKLATPAWMTLLGVTKLMFPRLFRNKDNCANLPNLPASTYSVLNSSDHDLGMGYIG